LSVTAPPLIGATRQSEAFSPASARMGGGMP